GPYELKLTYTLHAEGAYADYELKFEIRYTLTVNTADFDMSGIEFADGSFTYDGEQHSLQIGGELPEWITVTYEGNGQSQVGKYTVTVKFSHENPNYNEIADMTAQLEIGKRKVTISIDPVSSVAGEELAKITATVIEGSIVEGETPYMLICTPDKDTVGEYPVTFEYEEGYEDKYEIICENGVYIVSKKVQAEGGNEIDLPRDVNVEFKVTQSETSGDYSSLNGIKKGYWAQLWYRNENGTLGDEFTDEINCILTLSIPKDIIDAIRGGEEINREKIAEELKLYYVVDGDLTRIKNFKIAQKEDESWQVSFNYNEKFRAEIVFNAPGVEEPTAPARNFFKDYWMYIAIGAAVLLLVIILIVVLSIKKAHAGGYDDYDYDDDYDDDDDDDDDDYEGEDEDY
ncbi:MAG: hypothetical protein K2N23_02750, partial [Clostridia bacterium]|nr:hypothetical protein [Clostridia bacterium]